MKIQMKMKFSCLLSIVLFCFVLCVRVCLFEVFSSVFWSRVCSVFFLLCICCFDVLLAGPKIDEFVETFWML